MKITRRNFTIAAGGMIAGGATMLGMWKQVFAQTGEDNLAARFIVLSDTHWGGNNWRLERTENTVKALNHACENGRVDFIVINGDIVHDQPATQIIQFKPYLDSIKAPLYMTHGNHDRMSDEQFKVISGHAKDHHFAMDDFAIILLDTYEMRPDGSHRHVCPDLAYLQDKLTLYKDANHVFVCAHRCPTQNVDCQEWNDLLKDRQDVSGIYGHTHRRCDSTTIQGKVNHFCGHNTDKSRQHWLEWHSYRVVEITQDGRIFTHIYDYTNNVIREPHVIREAGAW